MSKIDELWEDWERDEGKSREKDLFYRVVGPLARQAELIEKLRSEEGSSVEIFYENPEGTGVNNNHLVILYNFISEPSYRRFNGPTLLAALEAAAGQQETRK